MAEGFHPHDFMDRRSEPRKGADRLCSAEISLSGVPIHRFKLKDISLNGACIVIKEDSSMMSHLKVGQVLNMKYYTPVKKNRPDLLKTEIKHITKPKQGRFKGHYLVGCVISERPAST